MRKAYLSALGLLGTISVLLSPACAPSRNYRLERELAEKTILEAREERALVDKTIEGAEKLISQGKVLIEEVKKRQEDVARREKLLEQRIGENAKAREELGKTLAVQHIFALQQTALVKAWKKEPEVNYLELDKRDLMSAGISVGLFYKRLADFQIGEQYMAAVYAEGNTVGICWKDNTRTNLAPEEVQRTNKNLRDYLLFQPRTTQKPK